MLETKAAVESAKEIVAVPDLDFVFFGPGDLAVNMGHPGHTETQDTRDAIEHLRTTAVNAGITMGCVASTTEGANSAVNDGFRILRVADDVDDLVSSLRNKLEDLSSSG